MNVARLSEIEVTDTHVSKIEQPGTQKWRDRLTKISRIVPKPVKRVFAQLKQDPFKVGLPDLDRPVVAVYFCRNYPRLYMALDFDFNNTFWGYFMDEDGSEGYLKFTISDLQYMKEYGGIGVKRRPKQEQLLTPLHQMIALERDAIAARRKTDCPDSETGLDE